MAGNEFPRVVYNEDGDWKTIHSEDERPDGWKNSMAEFDEKPEVKQTAAQKKAAKAAEKLREKQIQFLTENKVQFDPELSDEEIQALSDKLEEHLKAQAEKNDNGK